MIGKTGYYYFEDDQAFAVFNVLSHEEELLCNFFISSDEVMLNEKGDEKESLIVQKESDVYKKAKKIENKVVFERIFLGANDLLIGDY